MCLKQKFICKNQKLELPCVIDETLVPGVVWLYAPKTGEVLGLINGFKIGELFPEYKPKFEICPNNAVLIGEPILLLGLLLYCEVCIGLRFMAS